MAMKNASSQQQDVLKVSLLLKTRKSHFQVVYQCSCRNPPLFPQKKINRTDLSHLFVEVQLNKRSMNKELKLWIGPSALLLVGPTAHFRKIKSIGNKLYWHGQSTSDILMAYIETSQQIDCKRGLKIESEMHMHMIVKQIIAINSQVYLKANRVKVKHRYCHIFIPQQMFCIQWVITVNQSVYTMKQTTR